MSLTHHIKQLKLFTAIAIAAVIGTSLIVPSSIEARTLPNGWIHAGTSIKGKSIYVRPLSRNGNLVTYEEKFLGSSKKYVANCPAWQFKHLNGSRWSDVMPNSIGAAAHITVCSARMPSFAPSQSVGSHGGYGACDEKTDDIFWARYPSLRGKKLSNNNGPLPKEWIEIRSSICRI